VKQNRTTEVSFKVSRGPWFPPVPESNDVRGLRTYLWLPASSTEVVSGELGEIKSIAGIFEKAGFQWQLFELPKFDDKNADYAVIACSDKSVRHYLKIPNSPCLPDRKLVDEVARLDNEGSDDEASELLYRAGFQQNAREGIQVAKLIDRYSELVYRLTKSTRSIGPYVDVNRGGIFARSVRRVSTNWRRIGKSRTPPLSLVVRLADEIPDILERVCSAPRVVLRRQRELEAATRIQQVDSACIRWIGRQPGRTLPEKAGPRQRLMGVVRREDCDTAENRVVLDLLIRCKRAGELYVARHREFAAHKRLVMVRRFVRLCDGLIRQSHIAVVGRLVGIAQPNYVLQHEPRYRILWDAYQRLVRHEKVTQSSWIWRDRLWNEWIGLGLVGALSALSHRCPAVRKSILLSDEPSLGEFQIPESIGPWWIKKRPVPISVHLIPRNEISLCDRLPLQLRQLNPDFVIANLETKSCGIAIWSNLDVIHSRDTAERTARELWSQVEQLSLVGWKLLVLTGGGRNIEAGKESELVEWVTLPLMLQDHFESWIGVIQRALEYAS
jgi:Domain of unknown function (DUF2357)